MYRPTLGGQAVPHTLDVCVCVCVFYVRVCVCVIMCLSLSQVDSTTTHSQSTCVEPNTQQQQKQPRGLDCTGITNNVNIYTLFKRVITFYVIVFVVPIKAYTSQVTNMLTGEEEAFMLSKGHLTFGSQ